MGGREGGREREREGGGGGFAQHGLESVWESSRWEKLRSLGEGQRQRQRQRRGQGEGQGQAVGV